MSSGSFVGVLFMLFIIVLFFVVPALLIAANIISLFRIPKTERGKKRFRRAEYTSIILGLFYSWLASALFGDIRFGSDWEQVLTGNEIHTPIWTNAQPTIITLALLAVAGYIILSFFKRLTPLVIVLSMADMYIGIGLCLAWIFQIINKMPATWLFCLYPANCIIVALKTIRYRMLDWQTEHPDWEYSGKNKYMAALYHILKNSSTWPYAALVAAIPILGIMTAVLTLFGQQPDAVIRAWTETSDWRLSEKISPPNLESDGHYLCTVAAHGHRKLVKPLRMGERHGHAIVVNRQLCIANAFEQIIEEKTPRFHKHIRSFYDAYGLPLAKHIRSHFASDVVYLIMKPLEWIFLAVIYLCDTKPENRIAVQYLPLNRTVK